jgi:hypothetical protein
MGDSSFGEQVITNQKDGKGNMVFEKKRVMFAQTVTQQYFEPEYINALDAEENDDQLDGGQEGDEDMPDLLRR